MYQLYVGRPVGWQLEAPTVGTWLFMLGAKLRDYPEIKAILGGHYCQPRIHLSRNWLVRDARQDGATHLLMVDPDMWPDRYADQTGKFFFTEAWKFALEHPGCVYAAPYCGRPPEMPIHVFGVNRENKMVRLQRDQARQMRGWHQVAAVGTGLMLIDMKIFDRLQTPYFADVYHDETQSELKNSQDIWFAQQCSKAGVPIFVNFDTPAAHQQIAVAEWSPWSEGIVVSNAEKIPQLVLEG